jgi:uncharacterized protein DUF3455
LLLPMAGTHDGPTGGGKLTKTRFIQRLNTAGGVAPAGSTCATTTDIGKKALVPYSARGAGKRRRLSDVDCRASEWY